MCSVCFPGWSSRKTLLVVQSWPSATRTCSLGKGDDHGYKPCAHHWTSSRALWNSLAFGVHWWFSKESYFLPLSICTLFFTVEFNPIPDLPCTANGWSLWGGWDCWFLLFSGHRPTDLNFKQWPVDTEANTTHKLPGPKCWERSDSSALCEHSFPLPSSFSNTFWASPSHAAVYHFIAFTSTVYCIV